MLDCVYSLDGVSRSLVSYDFVFHDLNLHHNLRVLRQLEYLEPFDIRHSDLVGQDIQRIENTHSLHSIHLSPSLDFNCAFPVVYCRSNNSVRVSLYHLCFRKVWVRQ
jgi:hypothetical protein